MPRYVALIDGKPGACSVVFPDAPGCAAMGKTIEQALLRARTTLGEWIAHESSPEGLGIPRVRTVDELLKDPEVAESIKVTGAMMREV